ncbi:hypothetical protein H9P43_002814 [Blastocladiella emersonii ATCC 22665]|nr:hypothetical protein H9P43_002814 [Blastocladiella emersonii ATCC 22665]
MPANSSSVHDELSSGLASVRNIINYPNGRRIHLLSGRSATGSLERHGEELRNKIVAHIDRFRGFAIESLSEITRAEETITETIAEAITRGTETVMKIQMGKVAVGYRQVHHNNNGVAAAAGAEYDPCADHEHADRANSRLNAGAAATKALLKLFTVVPGESTNQADKEFIDMDAGFWAAADEWKELLKNSFLLTVRGDVQAKARDLKSVIQVLDHMKAQLMDPDPDMREAAGAGIMAAELKRLIAGELDFFAEDTSS